MSGNSIVKVSRIVEFFEDYRKGLSKGENAYQSKHVNLVTYDSQLNFLKAKVWASMKKVLYDISIEFNADGTLQSVSCSCPRGLTKCHHMAAVLFHAHYNISATDKSCKWVEEKPSSEQVMTIDEMFGKKDTYIATEYNVTEEDKQRLHSKLVSNFGHHISLAWYLAPEPNCSIQVLHNLEEVLFSEELRAATNMQAFLLEAVKVSSEKCREIERGTIGQSSNPYWLICKRYLPSASNFGLILNACRRNSFPVSLFNSLLGSYDLSGVKAVAYGKAKECDARSQFEQHFNVKVEECGLFIHSSGLIGASPDGLIGDDDLIEIKCPYSMRNEDVIEQLKVKSNTNTCASKKYIVVYDIEKKSFHANIDHAYYHQIQGQLYITNRKRCFFMIWSRVRSLIISIDRDESWRGNIEIIINFYLYRFLPYILKKHAEATELCQD